MKKKILFILGSVFVVCVLVGVILFITLSGENNNNNNENNDDNSNSFILDGKWYVFKYGDDFISDEIMIFNNGQFSDYRGTLENPAFSSSYTYEEDSLVLSDLNKQFVVRVVSNNYIIFIEPNTKEWKLIRVADCDNDINNVTSAQIVGEYQLLMVAGEERQNEKLVFSENSFVDYRNGEQFLQSSYEILNGHTLVATDVSMEFYVFVYKDALLLIEKNTGYVWELKKIN